MANEDRFDRCEISCIHEEAVAAVKQTMISDDEAHPWQIYLKPWLIVPGSRCCLP